MHLVEKSSQGFKVQIIADSISNSGHRLTTMVWRYPRFIHAEVMTHRDFSRNTVSSRAIPTAKFIEQVRNDPALPIFWGKNQPGMQAFEELDDKAKSDVKNYWKIFAENTANDVELLLNDYGLHKQLLNRLLEPFLWHTAIVSATNWSNFYYLRKMQDAQPEMKLLAELAYEAQNESTPILLNDGEWHIPFIYPNEKHLDLNVKLKSSVARCARVSYLNHDGSKPDLEKDLVLHDKLASAPHASPFEHQATPKPGRHGNFEGWMQYRKLIPNEYKASY